MEPFLPPRARMHCPHALHACTARTHCTHAVHVCTARMHCAHALRTCPARMHCACALRVCTARMPSTRSRSRTPLHTTSLVGRLRANAMATFGRKACISVTHCALPSLSGLWVPTVLSSMSVPLHLRGLPPDRIMHHLDGVPHNMRHPATRPPAPTTAAYSDVSTPPARGLQGLLGACVHAAAGFVMVGRELFVYSPLPRRATLALAGLWAGRGRGPLLPSKDCFYS